MLRTKSYLTRINKYLPYGSRRKIAIAAMVKEVTVRKVLYGEFNNEDVIRAAENIILSQGLATKVSLKEYFSISYEIAQNRTDKPFNFLISEIFPFIFPGLAFSLN